MLSLCLIVKNEESNLQRLLPTIVDFVDEVVLVDTGSTDNTKQIAQELCGEKLSYYEFTWIDDFSAARQFSFDKAKGEYILWADADDTIEHADKIAGIIADMEEEGIDSAVLKYEYQYDFKHNVPIITQWRERIVKAGVFEWKNRLHEVLVPCTPNKTTAKKYGEVVYYHHKTDEDFAETKHRNVRIMKVALDEDKDEPRNWYNMANALFGVEDYAGAITHYLEYLDMSQWEQERYVAYTRLATCERNLGNFNNSNVVLFRAMSDSPQYPDAYYHMGLNYMLQGEYSKALQWLSISAAKPIPTDLPVMETANYEYNLFKTIGYCYLHLEEYREALKYFEAIETIIPEEKNKDIIKELTAMIEESDILSTILAFAELDVPPEFYETIPKSFFDYPPVAIAYNKSKTPRTETDGKQIAIYCGATGTPFKNNSIETGGIGGSEEAVIEVARGLAENGYDVTVYTSTDDTWIFNRQNDSYGRLTYKHYSEFNPHDAWDVVISWRMPGVFKSSKLNANKTYLWLHDCNDPATLTENIIDNLDGVLVVSNWHASLYPHVPEEKMFVVENGINPVDFINVDTKRKQKGYCINTSSPDRGLECLLKLWGDIKKEVPHAELHWFYGWDGFDAHYSQDAEKMEWKESIIKLLDQPGVFAHGKVPPATLIPEYAKASVWLYPTEFTETFCITAIKCQYANVYPVTTNVAALKENVQYGVVINASDIYTNEKAQRKFVTAAVEALNDTEESIMELDGAAQWIEENKTWKQVTNRIINIINT